MLAGGDNDAGAVSGDNEGHADDGKAIDADVFGMDVDKHSNDVCLSFFASNVTNFY